MESWAEWAQKAFGLLCAKPGHKKITRFKPWCVFRSKCQVRIKKLHGASRVQFGFESKLFGLDQLHYLDRIWCLLRMSSDIHLKVNVRGHSQKTSYVRKPGFSGNSLNFC